MNQSESLSEALDARPSLDRDETSPAKRRASALAELSDLELHLGRLDDAELGILLAAGC